jgi:hypothetical protein
MQDTIILSSLSLAAEVLDKERIHVLLFLFCFPKLLVLGDSSLFNEQKVSRDWNPFWKQWWMPGTPGKVHHLEPPTALPHSHLTRCIILFVISLILQGPTYLPLREMFRQDSPGNSISPSLHPLFIKHLPWAWPCDGIRKAIDWGEGREDKGEEWGGWIQVWNIWYIVSTFVNDTMYPHPTLQ